MFQRKSALEIRQQLDLSPAVAILGARQIGKTTLAKQIAAEFPDSIYLDLENAQARAKLDQADVFFKANRHRLVVLDEIQNAPELFSTMRWEIDADRRPGRFLILGSASFKLLQQSQSLAGRLTLVDMAPLLLSEVLQSFEDIQTLWVRGGFPGSYTAPQGDASWLWRDAFVRHFLQTDLPALGINVEPELMRRFWRMVAHLHGQLFNASSIAASLGVSSPTVTRYLDHLVQSLMLRRLEPFHANLGKRLVKSPKIYVRDSGLLHYLLGIAYPALGLAMLRSFYEHRPAALPAHRIVINEAAWPWRLLYLNNNYHAVHHAHPGLAWYRIPADYRANRAAYLEGNGGFLLKGYARLLWRHALKPVDSPIHPGFKP